jgi:hypothetical protein
MKDFMNGEQEINKLTNDMSVANIRFYANWA